MRSFFFANSDNICDEGLTMKLVIFSLFFTKICIAQTVLPLCYLNQFKQDSFPWKMDDCLNYEEVFKNFQYFKQGQYSKPINFEFKNHKLIEQAQ